MEKIIEEKIVNGHTIKLTEQVDENGLKIYITWVDTFRFKSTDKTIAEKYYTTFLIQAKNVK